MRDRTPVGESTEPGRVQSLVPHLSLAERYAKGKSLRKQCPRGSHAAWKAPPGRPDAFRLVLQADEGRLPELLPLRHGRMSLSPFTFYRGAALNMAVDLATTPTTGIRVQCCGDAHLGNFRGFATAERRVLFAINDLDETLPAPWEWDLKRLGASIVIACRESGIGEADARRAVLTCAAAYRENMAALSAMKVLDVWYRAIEAEDAFSSVTHAGIRERAIRRLEKARGKSVASDIFPKLATGSGKSAVFKASPPTIFHFEGHRPGEVSADVKDKFTRYRESLPPSHGQLLDRFELTDAVIKVVGVGSVGTACWMLLLMAGEGDPLILQVKEARASVLEAFAGRSRFPNHGQRVVNGHRLIQPASDMLLGWSKGADGRHYYVRQLRDAKIKFPVEKFGQAKMMIFAQWCGSSLAMSHARSGDPALISGYLGKGKVMDRALASFSVAYADQTEKDHAALQRAIRAGKVEAAVEKGR